MQTVWLQSPVAWEAGNKDSCQASSSWPHPKAQCETGIGLHSSDSVSSSGRWDGTSPAHLRLCLQRTGS